MTRHERSLNQAASILDKSCSVYIIRASSLIRARITTKQKLQKLLLDLQQSDFSQKVSQNAHI